jgi:lipoprotein-anchoring transpeptidase ErfK/SrfK
VPCIGAGPSSKVPSAALHRIKIISVIAGTKYREIRFFRAFDAAAFRRPAPLLSSPGDPTMRLSQKFLGFLFVAALVAASSTAKAAVLITIDKSNQRMSVSVDGATRWTWPVSTGRDGHDTPSGSFQPFRMEPTHFSKEWDDAPMPHSIFFTKVGHAIHGTNDAGHLGTAVSHGCVRLSTANASQLYQLVKTEGMPNTKVVITGQIPYGEPEAYNQSWRGQNGPGENSFFGQSSYGQNTYDQNSARQTNGQRGNSRPNNGDWFFGSRNY